MLGEPEALLSHSAEREAGRGRNTNAHSLTHSFGAIQSLAHTLSLSLSHGRERESENQWEREGERAHEGKRRGESVEQPRRWAEGQAILQRSQDARGDLRQK